MRSSLLLLILTCTLGFTVVVEVRSQGTSEPLEKRVSTWLTSGCATKGDRADQCKAEFEALLAPMHDMYAKLGLSVDYAAAGYQQRADQLFDEARQEGLFLEGSYHALAVQYK